jgi:hypothetical protein
MLSYRFRSLIGTIKIATTVLCTIGKENWYTQRRIKLGEVNDKTRQMCWSVGFYRELPGIDYHMLL